MAVESPEIILIFAANPLPEAHLGLDREVREIQNGLRNSRKHFDVRQIWATRPRDLRQALLDLRPSYVHFCGHGTGENGIILEGQLLDADALANLFKLFAPNIKCVVLNACYSALQGQAIAKHIDYVVGMKREIGDSAAIEFAAAFYDALGAGESIEFAFDLGCVAIQIPGLPDHLTPELLSRNPLSESTAKSFPQSLSSHDWDGAPAVSLLYGREAVAELLRSWILDDFCRVVLITGMSGIGKTELATCLGRGGNQTIHTSPTLAAGIQGQFDSVLWRSLFNAPPAEDLFADILGVLSNQRSPVPLSIKQGLDEILVCLRERRCLLILDNVEAVLRPGDPTMRYREGYEGYGDLFELVAKTEHQSCLLLTSREKPRAIANLEGAKRPVRSLALTGIGTVESQNLFAEISTFSGSDSHWNEIVKLYSGNPLALELVARHIDQVFDGDLEAFLNSGRPVFTDLEEILDWHLDRLTPAETELIYWMAIEREPITLAMLYEDVMYPTSKERIASTLQSLQRRIPLEHVVPHQFTLQPVLTEHLTAKLVNQVMAAFLEIMQNVSVHSAEKWDRALSASVFTRLLNSHSLCKATAKEGVRRAQQSLIVAPIAEQMLLRYSGELRSLLLKVLDAWRRTNSQEPGYLTGNIINLLTYLNFDLHHVDFSHLRVWQAPLYDVKLHSTDFSFSDFRNTTFRQAFGTSFSLAYSADGEFLAVGDDNGEIRLFFASNSRLHLQCQGHADAVSAIAFSKDGQLMASASFDNSIRLWRVSDGKCINVLLGHESWVYSLDFSPDSLRLASASEDGTCRVWNIQTGQSVIPATQHQAFLAAVAFSPDGELLVVGGSAGVISVFRTSDFAHPTELVGHTGRIRSLAFSRQGDLLASGAEDRKIILWQPADGQQLGTLTGHSGAVMSLSFSDIGDLLASGSDDYTVRLWSTGRQDCVRQLYASPSRIWAVDCSPKDRTLATAGEDSAVRIWDLDNHQPLTTLRGYSNKTWGLGFCKEPSLLLAGNEDSLVRLWDIRDARTTMEFRGHTSRVWTIATSPDGRWGASGSDDLTVKLWDLQSGTCRHVMQGHVDWVRSVAFSSDSRFLASGGEDGKIMLWDIVNVGPPRMIQSSMPRVFAVEFCGSEGLLAAGGTDGEVHLFSPETGAHITSLKGHTGWMTDLIAFEQSLLASCSEDGTIRLWDLNRSECVAEFVVGHKVWCGAFYNAGKAFLSGSDDGTVRRWIADTGACDADVRTHQGAVWSLAVNSAEELVATAGDDGVIRLWQLPDLTQPEFPHAFRSPRPYEGMNITGATGLTREQKNALVALGAIEIPSYP
jgi:WD40 repeat protein